MSLNWSTEKVRYFKDHPDELWTKINVGKPHEQEDLNTETKSLVFGSMALGVGAITYKSAPDYYARWKFFYPQKEIYMKITEAQNAMAASYARSVLGAAVAVYASTGDVKMAANALWAAGLPVIMRYLNPNDSAFGKTK